MTSVRGRGRGGGGGGGRGGGGPNGLDVNARRGSWRGGPPGSASSMSTPRGNSPALSSTSPAPGTPNAHPNDLAKSTSGDKSKPPQKAFATDSEIAKIASPGAQRELKPWTPDADAAHPATNGRANGGAGRDSETFGGGANIPWDQFETNARLFGTTTSYKEEIYTTKLDRSGPGYKQREKEAAKLANEILGQTSVNPHVAEERNQAGAPNAQGEEEKYSGVQRAANAYVPPGARRGGSITGGSRPSMPNPVPAIAVNANGTAPAAQTSAVPQISNSNPAVATVNSTLPNKPIAASKSPPVPSLPPAPVRQTSDLVPTTSSSVVPDVKSKSPNPQATSAAPPTIAAPDKEQLGTVVDQFRQFVGNEREKVEAKKQSIIKLDREKTLADLKSFKESFKVPLPIPKDILPLLAKDEEKQKSIQAQATSALEAVKAGKTSDAKTAKSTSAGPSSKKVAMSIPEIPPFKPRQPAPLPPQIPVPESSTKDIPLAISPAPSATSQASANAQKLNPNANAFVFKPNPAAASFKPGQPSSTSPSAAPTPIAPSPGPGPGPSGYKNPFFRDPPIPPKGIQPRDDFNPWKHGPPAPAASSIHPQWPYTGRKWNAAFLTHPMQPMSMGMEDEPTSPPPGPPMSMPGMPPNFPPYGYRYQPGMPPQSMPGRIQNNPMFSPGHGYAQLPGGGGQPQHMGGGGPHQSNGMPMYYHQGLPQNPHFIQQQHMQYNPGTPSRLGQGLPGGPGPGPGIYYPGQLPTPQPTPQMHPAMLQQQQAPPPQPQFQTSPIPPPQNFDGHQ